MKTLDQIIKQDPVYLHDWSKDKKIGVIGDFEDIYLSKAQYEQRDLPTGNKDFWLERKAKMTEKLKEWENVNILFASYGNDNYEGEAFVLFEKQGKLYEVNARHCSCYGLEGQFEPEETTIEALSFRLVNGSMGANRYADNEFANELKSFLGI